MAKQKKKPFPQPLSLKRLIGPSFIILALGLGSGEVILWPYLVANHGLGIAWGAALGITFQYFMNMEIERYALVKGESVFVGAKKIFRWVPIWFIISTFIGFGLPGIVAASAKVFAQLIGVSSFKWIAIGFLLLVGFILSAGKTVYGMMESITKTVLLIGAPFVLILAVITSSPESWTALAQGIVGRGEGFWFLPGGISLASFLAAFAYAGAGGNLNLTQSIYIKEKGYGMGKYSQPITGLFSSKKSEEVKLSGESFEVNEENISKFKQWWKVVSLEHLIVFWGVGLGTMLLLMLLSYNTAFGSGAENAEGISFVITQGAILSKRVMPAVGMLFYFAVAVMLFQTQLGVMDSTSRIMSENAALLKLKEKTEGKINLSRLYYTFLWAQIAFGVILFLFNIHEPRSLITVGAVINAVAMFIHLGVVNWTNYKILPKATQPSTLRRMIIVGIFLFFGGFSLYTLLNIFL